MDRLVSKIAAGGLGAGIFLIWWPLHVHGEGLTELALRGLLWTLTFELLLNMFGPLEDRVARRLQTRVEARRDRVRERIEAFPAPARTGGVVALACMGVAAPLALLAGGPTEVVDDEPRTKVVKQVIVERPVVEKKVVVRRVVAQAPSALQSAGAAPSVQTQAPTQVRPAAKRTTQSAGRTARTERTARPTPRTTTTVRTGTATPTASRPAAQPQQPPAATPATPQSTSAPAADAAPAPPQP